MSNWALPAGLAVGAAILLFGANAAASTSGGSTPRPSTPTPTGTGAIVPGGPQWSAYSAAQQQVIALVAAEARRQGVPVELALATADVESTFRNAVNPNGPSYGPMQVHTSHLAAGETVSDLQNQAFATARGVSILKRYLAKANGNTVTCRLFYFCGPHYTDTTCKPATREIVKARWATATAKWKLKSSYPV